MKHERFFGPEDSTNTASADDADFLRFELTHVKQERDLYYNGWRTAVRDYQDALDELTKLRKTLKALNGVVEYIQPNAARHGFAATMAMVADALKETK